jgi:hypothetical protein
VKQATDLEMRRVFGEARQGVTPSPADRLRISSALQARLGANVLDLAEGVPPSLPGPLQAGAERSLPALSRQRGHWVGSLVCTGVIMGALGLVVGYSLGRRAAGSVPREMAGAASGALSPVVPATPGPELLEGAERRLALPVPDAPSASNRADDVSATPAPGRAMPPPAPRQRVTSHERAELPPGTAAAQLGFAEAVERLRRANRALRQGRASLALIQLAELDRLAGETLREEREVTRILASCAVGDEAGARQAARELMESGGSSIYARRIEGSCAGDRPRLR